VSALDVDLVVVGSGFGGSLLAMVARRTGLRVALVERGQHPRFAIGESASPLAGVLIEQIADRYGLHRIRPLAAYGPWRRTYPDVTCGLKRGFTYFVHEAGRPFRRDADRASELLVAASPADEVSDTHWLRSDVDHFLVREAIATGVEYLDQTDIERIDWDASSRPTLLGSRQRGPLRISGRAVVDATGPRGLLARTQSISSPGFSRYPRTQALFSHFVDVPRCDELPDFVRPAGSSRASASQPLPYPEDDAALHHVFEGGWMWVLRFENGVTSAGIAVEEWLASELGLADGEPAWRRFLDRFPSIQRQFAGATAIREFTWMPQLSYRAASAAGHGWAMLPSAAAFVDPLFSSGIPMTLVGVERLGRLIESGWPMKNEAETSEVLERYSDATLAEADHTARFVAGCYASFTRFDDFRHYSMLYFAAASYSEMSRRLGRTPPGFLMAADPRFAADLARLSPALGPRADLDREVAVAIERINVAGLCDPARKHWYPADMEDAVRGAAKLGVSASEVRAMLEATLPAGLV
jgi:FADH2 O2-dependent halogenase